MLTEKAAPVQKKFLEVLGSYHPRKKYFQVKEDRLKHWLGQHVALSETLNNLLVTKGLFSGPKVKAFSIPKKPVVAEATAAKSEATSAPAETSALAEPVAAPAETPVPEKVATAPVEEVKAAEQSKLEETTAQ